MQTTIEKLKAGDTFRLADNPYLFRLTELKNLMGEYRAEVYFEPAIDIYLATGTSVYRF